MNRDYSRVFWSSETCFALGRRRASSATPESFGVAKLVSHQVDAEQALLLQSLLE